MSRSRRVVSMVSATLAVAGLAFVVAVAASSRPGEGDEPWLDVNFRGDLDLTPVFAWMTLIAAVIGAILFVLALLETGPPQKEERSNRLIWYVVAIIIFLVAARFVQPIAETAVNDAIVTTETTSETATTQSEGGFWVGWIISILIAAVIAAALTRIGLSIRSGTPPLDGPETATSPGVVRLPSTATPRARELGDDPRSQVLNAYGDFEEAARDHGSPRLEVETAMRHASRARAEMSLDSGDVEMLSRSHADARYGLEPPTPTDAAEASAAAERLKGEMDS